MEDIIEELAAFDDLHDEVNLSRIRDVSAFHGTRAGEEAIQLSSTIDNDRARVSLGREGARVPVVGKNSQLLSNLLFISVLIWLARPTVRPVVRPLFRT